MEAYDAAVIGAGVEGLAGATMLARAGLRTIVLERNLAPGGRCQTIEFHPGYFASAFGDDIAPVPRQLSWSLDLARRGALFASSARSTALWPGRSHAAALKDEADPFALICREAGVRREEVLGRALSEPLPRNWRGARRRLPPWPADDWSRAPLLRVIREFVRDEDGLAHAVAASVCGRAVDPSLNGSALHLLVPRPGTAMPRGGLGGLARVLVQVAREAGATVSCGLDVTEIRHRRGRVTGVALADGTELKARAVISTLDLKRTFLTLFKWAELPPATGQRVNLFRPAAATARLLLALDGLPALPRDCDVRTPLFLSPDLAETGRAFAAWKSGSLAAHPPAMLRFVSAIDPFLSPQGKATATVTIGCIPHRFFDGAWTDERRTQLRERVIRAVENVIPGVSDRILGEKLIVPPDIEEAIGRTEGDLAGGEIAPDQMLAMRPWSAETLQPPRTALRGLYLAGPSTTSGLLATGASGVAAADALIADRRGWFS